MSIIGGAVLTPVMGLVSEIGHSIALAYLVPLIAYVCVALFSFLSNGQRALSELEINA
jgi:FHS family L-fucose permease-like MFS transporter